MADKFLVIRGKLDWAKLTGTARPYKGNPKYDKGPSWSVDITPDAKSLKLLADNGLTTGGRNGTGKLRTPKGKDTRTEKFLTLRVLENRADGTKNPPPKIVDVRGNKWNGDLIGNGSIADIKVKVKDYGSASEDGVYLQAVRILDHVEYESKAFDDLSSDDEYFAEGSDDFPSQYFPEDEDLDDDIPF